MQYLLGIDIGTTGTKAGLYTIAGAAIHLAYRQHGTMFNESGWAEEDAEIWWKNICDSIRELLDTTGIRAGQIAGISISCTNALIPVDRQGNVLCKAIMQMDNRATAQVTEINDRIPYDRQQAICGNRNAVGTCWAPGILWMKQNAPEIYRQTHCFLAPSGVIVQKLCGAFTIDHSRAATSLLFDIRKMEWSTDMADALGIEQNKLPRNLDGTEIAGYVSKCAAAQTGLMEGTPVAVGVMDTAAAMLGSGVWEPYDTIVIMGTVSRCCSVTVEPRFDDRFINAPYVSKGRWFTIGAANGCGISMRWFVETFCNEEIIRAQRMDTNPYALVDQMASGTAAGAEGLIYLPYLNGERSPIWDPAARGVFLGFSPHHGRAHFARAVMEGVAYATRQNYELMRAADDVNCPICLSGGGCRSALWQSIMADVLGVPVTTLHVSDTEPLGSAMVAASAVGLMDEQQLLSMSAVKSEAKVWPDEKAKQEYNELFDVYKRLYPALAESYRALNAYRTNRSKM